MHSLVTGTKSFGNSMSPLLHDGDIIYLKPTPFRQLKINDIVTYKKGNTFITHRIIYKASNYLIMKGDGNMQADNKITPGQIIGRVSRIKRKNTLISPEDMYLFQSTLYFQEIVKVKSMLLKTGIDFVFLKGLPLHLYFEKTHPRRYYADCDVLIDKTQLKIVEKLLKKLGYKRFENSFSSVHKKLKDKETEISFCKKVKGVIITFDVHLEPVFLMVQLGRLDALYSQKMVDELAKDFLANRQVVIIQGEKFPILSPAHLLLYLALHFFHDNYTGYHKILFLSTVMNVYKQNKNTLLLLTGIIRYYKLQNFVYPSYFFLKKYYNKDLSSWFLAQIKPNKQKLHFMKKKILKMSIFNEVSRVKAGTLRFRNLFYLSPYSMYKKVLILFNPQVIYMTIWLFQKRYLRSITKQ